MLLCLFLCTATATTEIYTLSLHDALPICCSGTNHQDIKDVEKLVFLGDSVTVGTPPTTPNDFYRMRLEKELKKKFPSLVRSEEHTSELQSRLHLVCRLLLEKKKTTMLRQS